MALQRGIKRGACSAQQDMPSKSTSALEPHMKLKLRPLVAAAMVVVGFAAAPSWALQPNNEPISPLNPPR